MFTTDYFIEKFSAIPDNQWVTGSFRKDGQRCALGHCGVTSTLRLTPEAKALCSLFEEYFKTRRYPSQIDLMIKGASRVMLVNDIEQPHTTPKGRILKVLGDIREREIKELQEAAVLATKQVLSSPVDPGRHRKAAIINN